MERVEETADTEYGHEFLREIAERFVSRQSNVFLLSGNVNDKIDGLGEICPAGDTTNKDRFVYLGRYLSQRLESRGRLVITYNIARGIEFSDESHKNKVREFYARHNEEGYVEDAREQRTRLQRFDRLMSESQVYSLVTLKFLELLCQLARKHRRACPGLTIIIRHAETLLPNAPLAHMSDVDRQKLTLMTEWFTDPDFIESNEQVLMIAPTAASVHEALRQLQHLSQIEIPLPDIERRQDFIAWMEERSGDHVKLRHSRKELAAICAGMTLLTLEHLFLSARHTGGELDEKQILDALNRLLTSELGDKIEMVKPTHTMDDVVGATALKKELSRLKSLLDTRDPKVMPVGILVAGPNGVGKTFIYEAWASECDRLVIVLKNLRSMYYGQTDQIFEKLRHVLEALGNVIVFIDEADTVFAKPGSNTHETEARLFGSLIKMMGNPRNRGKILWLLLTARPDNLAPDLKRSGRAGLHLPVFDPEGEDRANYIDFVLKRAGYNVETLTDEQRAMIAKCTEELSPADFNEVLVELRAEKARTGTLTFEQAEGVIGNIMPSQIAAQRRIQTLQARLHCSRRSLIPPSLEEVPREDVEIELDMLLAKHRL